MSTKKATKRALLTSILAICLCLVMLIGSTFAWFTDTASTGVNKIQAGNLDVQLLMKNSQTNAYDDISDSTTPIFGSYESEKAQNVNSDTLWEPGKTQVAYLAIKNNGNLDLKYQVQLKVTNPHDGKDLYEVMKYAIVAGNETSTVDVWDASKGNSVVAGAQVVSGTNTTAPTDPTGVVLNHGETHYFALLVHMDENAGNTYMGGKVEFDLTVLAAQLNSEFDSFGPDYDASAQYPDTAFVTVSDSDALAEAISSAKDASGAATNKVVAKLNPGDYTLPDGMDNKDVTITGTKETVINIEQAIAPHNATITMDGVTVQSPNANYTGIQHTTATIFKNCVIKGQPFLYAKDAQFIDCTFEQNSSDAYNVWTYGAENVLFKGCTFNCAGKSVLIYNEGTLTAGTVEFQDCKFNATTAVSGKAAIEIDCTYSSYKVIIDQATADNVTGFGTGSVSGNFVWNVKKGVMPTTVTVAGTQVYPTNP